MPNVVEAAGGVLFVFIGWLFFFFAFSKLLFWIDINEKDVIKIRVTNTVFLSTCLASTCLELESLLQLTNSLITPTQIS